VNYNKDIFLFQNNQTIHDKIVVVLIHFRNDHQETASNNIALFVILLIDLVFWIMHQKLEVVYVPTF